jgi:hypothetical protein
MIAQKNSQPNPHLKKKTFDGKVSRLNKLNLPGTQIPAKVPGDYGKTSRFLEEIVTDLGYPVDKQHTLDLPEIGVEIKGRDHKSSAPHTISAMSVDTIIKTPYYQSAVAAKMQQQFRVYFDHSLNVIKNQEMCDFSLPEIQERLRDAYEAGRRDLAAGRRGYAIKNSRWGYFEKHLTENTYKFRIPHAAMKFFITLAGTQKTVSGFFNEE